MSADNFHATIRDVLERLPEAIQYTLSNKSKIWGYKIIPRKNMDDDNVDRFILFRWEDSRAIQFPVPLTPLMCAEIIKQWLLTVDYGQEPDHDGDNEKGFYLSTGHYWDHIDDMGHGACLDIRPCWMMYGK